MQMLNIESKHFRQPGMKYLLSKVFHESLPQCVEHLFSDQRAHLWNIDKANK